MRRSSHYRDILIASIDIETQNTNRHTIGDFPEISVYRGTLTAEDQRKRSKQGWPNWYINRGRISYQPTSSELRQISWRRPK